jgi:hypothetical protein
MKQTSQYYFSAAKLQAILNKFSDPAAAPAPGYILKGIVFLPGSDAVGSSHIFAYPLFTNSALQKVGSDVLLVQNFDETTRGCPYPPPCD